MIPKFVLPALLAICSIVSALPATRTANTVELFKRDDPLTQRDFELADLHGVNLAESYKHAVIRRDDGDDITIWVHRSFVEERDASKPVTLVERQARPVPTGYVYLASPRRTSNCERQTYINKTTSTSPFADSTASLATWAENTNGTFSSFWFYNVSPPPWIDAVVAGTNSGGNVLFSFRTYSVYTYVDVSTSDIFVLVTHALSQFKWKYGNTWRVETEGTMNCWQSLRSLSMSPVRYHALWRLTGIQIMV